MALDPKILAALSAGAKTTSVPSGEFTIGIEGPDRPGAFSLGQSVIDILSTGGYATAGLTSKLGQNIAAIGRGELGAVADIINPISNIAASVRGVQDRRTYSQNLRDMGVQGDTAVWLGLALDIGLDPTTYITGGMLAGAKGAVQGAKLASKANKPAKSLIPNSTLAGATRELTDSQKIGNLLSGIGTGYAKGKANYKVSVTGNKLERLSRKADKKAKKTAAAVSDAIGVAPSITAKIAKTQQKLSQAEAKAASIDIPVTAGQSKTRPPGAETNSSAIAARAGDELRTGSVLNERLNKLAQSLIRPAAITADVAKFNEIRTSFLDKAFDFSSRELAALRGSNAGFSEISIDSVRKYLNSPKVIQDANKARVTMETILEAPARIADEAIELQEEIVSKGGNLETATVDDLLFIADETTDATIKRQALEAFELSKQGLDEAALSAPGTNKPWIQGIQTPQDAGDAARSIVDWIAPQLRDGDPAAFKAISNAIEAALKPRLTKAAGGAEEAMDFDVVEEVIGKFLDDDLVQSVNKISDADLSAAATNTYNDIAEVARDLQDGKLELSAADKRNLASVLDVPEDNIAAALQKIVNSVDGVEDLINPTAGVVPTEKGVISPADAATSTGNAAGADAAAFADDVVAGDSFVDDVLSETPSPESQAALLEMREQAARQFVDDISSTGEITDAAERARVVRIVRDSILPSITRQIAALAKAQNKSVDQVLREALEGDIRVITEDPEAFTVGGALKLDELGSHGRIDIFARLVERQAKFYKEGPAADVLSRELRTASAVENLMRSLGIPVRSTESTIMALQRKGIKPGTKKARGVRPEYSSVTWADIGRLMVNSGKLDLAHSLRRARGEANRPYKLGNFAPTSIEAAWLSVKRLKESGEDFAKGSANREEIIFALDNVEEAGTAGFTSGFHVKAAETLGSAEASIIAKTKDDLIDFLADNYDALKAIDTQREGLIIAAQAERVRPIAVETFAQMAKFSTQFNRLKEAFKAGEISEAAMEVGVGDLLNNYNRFLDQISTGDFSDPEIAKKLASTYKSIFLNASIKGPDGNVLSLAPLMKSLDETLNMTRAMDAADTPLAAKNARREQKTKGYEQQAAAAAEALAKGDEAGNPMPVATEAQDVAIQEALSLRGAFSEPQGKLAKLAVAFNGNYGMKATFKTIVASSELTAVSYSHWFSLGLKSLQRMSRGREAELMSAFKAVQSYRKELAAATELGEEFSLDAFMAAYAEAGRGTFDMDFFNLIDQGMEVLLGSDSTFGAAKSYGVMTDELNVALRQFGLKSIQVGEKQDPSTFWHALDPAQFPEKSPLEFMNLMNLAVQRAASRVEIATQFDFFVGKTVDDIKRAGENIDDYVRIDEDTTIGKLLGETKKLVAKEDFDKLTFVQKYLDYDSTFSDSAFKRVIEVSDRITYVLKSSNTLIRPGHHVVSIVGEAAMNALAGVRLSSYNNTARILNRFRPGQYENADEPFKAYAELDARKGKRIRTEQFDNVYWLKGETREIVPDEAIYRLAQKYGVLVHPGGGIEDFIVSGEPSAFLKGAYGKFHQGMNKISVIASHRDNFFRMSHFIDELQRTKGAANIEEAALAAATAIREWHPTSASLSAFERKYMRRAVYFYTWQRVAMTKVIGTMIERPGIATIPSKIQYAFADANGFNPESFGDPWDPDGIYASWHTESVFGPQFVGPRGAGDAYGIQPAIQPIDILAQTFEPFNVQPGANPLMSIANGVSETFANNANPIIKTLTESWTGRRLVSGSELPSPSEYLINQVGFLNTISKVTGVGQDENPYETEQDRAEKNNRLLLNLLLGQRITDYSTPATQYKWTVDQQEMARRLAEK